MGTYGMIGVLAFVASFVASRFLSEKAYKLLTADDKVRLMDAFSGFRKYSLVPLLVLMGGFYLIVMKLPEYRMTAVIGLLVITVVYVAVMNLFNVKVLKALNLPGAFVRGFVLSRTLTMLGMLAMFASIFIGR